MPEPTVFVVADRPDDLKLLIGSRGLTVRVFGSAREFLQEVQRDPPGCLVLDARGDEVNGLELQQELVRRNLPIPIVFISNHGDVCTALRAVHAGAVDFLEQPFSEEALLSAIGQALERDAHERARSLDAADLRARLARLTPRERQVLRLLLDGAVNKIIARQLNLSVRTVEIHRARILAKMGVHNAVQLVRRVVGGQLPPEERDRRP